MTSQESRSLVTFNRQKNGVITFLNQVTESDFQNSGLIIKAPLIRKPGIYGLNWYPSTESLEKTEYKSPSVGGSLLNLPLIPYIARILAVPKNYLIPLILFFSITGIYVMSFNNFDIYLMIGIAVVATFMRLYDFPMPPLILAFVLGGLMEENLRRSLLISDGSFNFLWGRPLTTIILLFTVSIIGWQDYKSFKK